MQFDGIAGIRDGPEAKSKGLTVAVVLIEDDDGNVADLQFIPMGQRMRFQDRLVVSLGVLGDGL